ncbi:hypothetical protein EXIGLDRAFT_833298 [Exidia glandulosa HHB12029]|uniref:Uncharacterized protein n=1 Tax=Exidia glandulosa HHB12029 TaxID=1314781 RepID=A0A165KTX6_EXIGL|nr:hypothetical protein EXIGLDRAFT_833298 [Exidia glandulosa HHB12029]
MSLVLRAFVLFAPLLSLVASAATIPTATVTLRSIDEPLDAGSTYMRYTARENALHKPAEHETNADRLRRGLPPLPPRINLHKNKHTPTKSSPQHHASASSKPTKGNVHVKHHKSGKFLGFLSKNHKSPHVQRFTITSDPEEAMTVRARTPSPDIPSSLTITNPEDGFVNLGFVTGPASAGAKLAPRSANYAVLSGTDETRGGDPPAAADAAYGSGSVESAVWTYESQSQTLTPKWVNPDGSLAITKLVYLPRQDALLVTGDEQELGDTFGDDIVPVVFELV